MGETEGVQRVQSSIGTYSSSILKQPQPACSNSLDIPQLNTAQFRQFSQNFNVDNGSKRVGMPPIPPLSPYSQIPVTRNPQQIVGSGVGLGSGSFHSRSLSQPSFFSLDSLPPLSPSPYRDSPPPPISDQIVGDMSNSTRIPESLPPRKTHRRSNSDIPFGFSTILQTSPPLIPLRGLDKSDPGSKPVQLVKRESGWEKSGESNVEGTGERKSEGEVVDDLFSAYMNLDNLDRLNPQGNETREDLDSSDNEATSSVNDMKKLGVSDKREGIKRSASGEMAPTTRHYRSVSVDSFMEKMNFVDESPKLNLSPGGSNSMDTNSNAFSLEFGNGEFTGAELKKIMANEKLAEIALADPKRAKRILANRQSAARSKERKMRYITELEHKVQTLQTEATTLSAQVTLLQREQTGLTSQNNELKFRLQAMEQQAQLRDALTEALTSEVQHLKITATELSGDAAKFSQLSINPQTFPNGSTDLKHESAQ